MLCRVEMPANEQIFGRFYRWRMLRGQRGSGRSTLLMLALLLMLAAGAVVWMGPVPLIGLAVLVLGWLFYSLWLRPNSLFRKKEGAAMNTEVTLFTPNGFTRTVRSEEGGLPENTSVNYSTLVMAVETGRDFYLFTSQTQAYMVDKEYITDGSAEALSEVLRTQLGKRFKGKKRAEA